MSEPITGATLAELRHRLGFSQQQVAEKLGVRKNTVWRWEKDRTATIQPIAYYALYGLIWEQEEASADLQRLRRRKHRPVPEQPAGT